MRPFNAVRFRIYCQAFRVNEKSQYAGNILGRVFSRDHRTPPYHLGTCNNTPAARSY